MEQAFLEVREVSKSYEGTPVISKINLTLQQGELVSCLGSSGIGKTTLFQIISGLEPPDSGEIWFKGENLTGVSGRFSYMQQKDLLLPYKNVLDNLAIPLRLKGLKKKDCLGQILPLLPEFGLEGIGLKYPSQLSGGMGQRVALLRAYLFAQEVLLLDEPFSALDAITKSAMHRWFKKIVKSHGISALFITHDLDEAIVLSDRIYILSGVPGKIDAEIAISSTAPRDFSFTLSPEFIQYKRLILEKLQ